MKKMDIYNHLPVWAQNMACWWEGRNLKKARFGSSFRQALAEYENHNDWSYEQMCDYRDAQLRKLVRHSYDTTIYYRKLFDEGGINPDSIKTLDDLKRIPILKKATIMENPGLFLSSAYSPDSLVDVATSGSTGSCLVLHVSPDNIARQYAIWWRYRRRLGIDMDMWHAEFGSRIIVPPQQKKPPYWRISYPLKQEMFSAFHGNASTYRLYFEEIRRRGYHWFHFTPSVFVPFASFCLENDLHLDRNPDFITAGAENLYDFQRKIVHDAFGVWPRTHYGLTEAVANFSETPDGVMEVDEDFGAVEFVPDGESCHIIGTSLINYAMPLIRYDTADIATVSQKVGQRGRIVDRIDGRNGDCIYLPDGTHVATLSALFTGTKNIVEAQIHQQQDYSLVIRYVPKNEQYADDLELVKNMLVDRIGSHTVPFSFVRMEKLPRTARGKLRYIVSDVKR